MTPVTDSRSRLAEDLYREVVDKAVGYAMRRYSLPLYLMEECRSVADVAFAAAVRTYQPSQGGLRPRVFQCVVWACVDEARRQLGRGELRRANTEVSIEHARRMVEPGRAPEQTLLDAETLRELLAACRNSRERQVALHLMAGFTATEIAFLCGVHVSAISETRKRIARRLRPRDSGEQMEALNAREMEVLLHAAAGRDTGETATLLNLSAETVKTHRKRAIAKLRARNMTHAVALVAIRYADKVGAELA